MTGMKQRGHQDMTQPTRSALIKDSALAEAYETVTYTGYPYAQTHPDRLATVATLFGMNPAPVDHCRVLEVGCGDGGNLIPMAFTLPESSFVGIDLAPSTIARGQEMIAQLGLRNIELSCEDILSFESSGQFDYIIAHGVFSWVPEEVREKILEICRGLLAPHGVAYISYNTYPGYRLREVTREMMRFHVRGIADPSDRVSQGLTLLKFLLQKFPGEGQARSDLYGALLYEQLDLLTRHRHPEQIYHDDLADLNTPFYFRDFVGQAECHGLKYLAEADYFEMQDYIYPQPIREFLGQFGDEQVVLKEQYLDFIKCRTFRQTLLCHREAPVSRSIDPRKLASFYLESQARAVAPEPDLSANALEEFRGLRDARMQTDYPLAKAALLVLGESWPRSLTWDELTKLAYARLGDAEKANREPSFDDEVIMLAEILVAACGSDLVRMRMQPPMFVTEVRERPLASPLARMQASRGGMVTNLMHKSVEIEDDLGRELFQLLDGTRTRAELCDEMVLIILERSLFKRADGSMVDDQRELQSIIASAVDVNLKKIAGMALLVG
ncbi:MAG: class I SAM-dependent methyltransferase [Gammaproteobacteria bacterium]|nr:class I SAM-dependent methyltransferase [Gammaproteobacteria bacterium]